MKDKINRNLLPQECKKVKVPPIKIQGIKRKLVPFILDHRVLLENKCSYSDYFLIAYKTKTALTTEAAFD